MGSDAAGEERPSIARVPDAVSIGVCIRYFTEPRLSGLLKGCLQQGAVGKPCPGMNTAHVARSAGGLGLAIMTA